MVTIKTIAAYDLRPGDVWTSDKDDVTVHSVTPTEGWVAFTGTITRGYGRGTKSSWKIRATQQLDVLRSET